MNFLSHIYLSGNTTAVLLGNFIGDFVKGKQFENYPKDVQRGILLHREIDFFTDSHPIVTQSKDKLRASQGHYSGVVIDIFYDHFLAANWWDYCSTPLHDFANATYKTLQKNAHWMPPDAQFMLPYMIRDNWLVSYKRLEGIEKVCKGMAQRTKFKSNMANAPIQLKKHYDALEEEFRTFFPLLNTHCQEFMTNID